VPPERVHDFEVAADTLQARIEAEVAPLLA
jgi:hypothetical protein